MISSGLPGRFQGQGTWHRGQRGLSGSGLLTRQGLVSNMQTAPLPIDPVALCLQRRCKLLALKQSRLQRLLLCSEENTVNQALGLKKTFEPLGAYFPKKSMLLSLRINIYSGLIKYTINDVKKVALSNEEGCLC